ncbi:hypothetical protein ARHIZOSPH14_11670 [Agromyces rhizosphaerae]|uniref:HTH tetR-type domain-containing protein n=1 Tax=Agromyces rhizosphaerae TaxID=88374 RepID=A0A9W6FNY7_9MICO|nr:TetR/AcrR family transcriptional regulator [Agromyces rhizosphaerae]GLI26925.1 hypothetical protein ARHIZOSPH14_11670 [Agromyces rhizosphaerae]
MSTVPGPRRRASEETTAAIERAAIDLVTEHGYDRVTVDMICDAAGISQRTFFNHFKTKDAALLGSDAPMIDERAAREFIVSDGPLLAEATRLVRFGPDRLPADPALIIRRLTAISQHPMLIARQMERLTQVEDELRQILELRLRQDAIREGAGEDELEAVPEQAELVTHLLAGLMRYVGLRWARAAERGEPVADPSSLADELAAVIRKLG